MANNFAVTDKVASVAAASLGASLVLGRTVFRDVEKEFEGGYGDTIRIRVPKAIPAKPFIEGTTTITDIVQTVNEGTVPLKLSTHAVSAVSLSPKDYSLNVFSTQVQAVVPTSQGVAEYIENAIATERLNPKIAAADALIIDPANVRDAILDAGVKLDKAKVPGARWLAVSPDVKKLLLADPMLSAVNSSGGDDALADAVIGRLHGFNVVVSPYLDAGAVAYAQDAFAMAIRAPYAPPGSNGASAEFSDSTSSVGYALTVLQAFHDDTLTQRIIAEAFVGTAEIDPARSVGLKLSSGAFSAETMSAKTAKK